MTNSHDNLGHDQSAIRDTALQYNKLQADVAALQAKFIALLGKLDADAGVADTNYTALESPGAMTSTTIGVNGVQIS